MSGKFAKINRDPFVCWNQPRIITTQLTVYDVVSGIDLEGLQEYMQDYELDLESVHQAVNYCTVLECQKSEGDFCHGCILNTLKHGWEFNKKELQEFSFGNKRYVRDLKTNTVYLGSLEEYEEQSFGRMGWRVAELMKEKYNL